MIKKRIRTLIDFIGSIKPGDFKSFAGFRHSIVIWWVGFVILCFVVALLATISLGEIPSQIKVGQIAPKDIRADRNYEIVDEEATDKFKQEAISGVLAVYDFDRRILPEKQKKISEMFKLIHDNTAELLKDTQYKHSPRLQFLPPDQIAEFRLMFEEGLGLSLTDDEWNALVKEDLSEGVEKAISNLLLNYLNKPIITDSKELESEKERGVAVRQILSEGQDTKETIEEFNLKDVSSISTIEQVKAKINKNDVRGKFSSPAMKDTIVSIAQQLIGANFTFDRAETEKREEESSRSIKSVLIKIQAGESIIRSGARYEPWHVKVLDGIRKEKESISVPLKFVGIFILTALLILSSFYFAEKFLKNFAPEKKDLVFMSVLLISVLLLLRLAMSLTSAMQDSFLYNVPYSAFFYLIPVAAGTMLLRMVLNAEISIIFAIVLSIIIGAFADSNLSQAAFTLISSIVALNVIANADKRATIIKAGMVLGLINVFLVLAFRFINSASVIDAFSFVNIAWYILFAFISGLGAVFFVLIAAPIAESLFDYTTDIKLLELANLNHPLLRELIIRAPGTYHHSHLVGILAEAAAEAIGANALLVRVAAYYHDIGKIKKPDYFTENQKTKEDKYEKLSPHMSALIVSSHVKDGVEMAKENRLPKVIQEMIPQHHGTKMISFFYNKAKEQEDPKHKAQEKDFRYPGPKPQTRESGILLLADVAEAAVRSLKEKSTNRIQQTIQDAIDRSFSEAQLDECDLTLKDLNLIANAFSRIAMGIYHQRIEYPVDEAKPQVQKIVKTIGEDEDTYNEDLDPKHTS